MKNLIRKNCIQALFCLIISLTLSITAGAVNENNRETGNNLYGHVTDIKTGKKVSYAIVAVKGTNIMTAADAEGYYRIQNLPKDQLAVEVKAMGYRTMVRQMTINSGDNRQTDFALTEDEISLDEIVVSSNRTNTLRREAPSLVNVLDGKLFNVTNSCTLAQGLSFQPGVRMETNCQNCGFSQVRINGLDGHYSQILIDSRPVFSSLNGVYGLEQIPTNMIERVEVVRGGGSALYGASAIGGTINIITKEPLRNSAEFSHILTSIEGKGTFENNTTANASLVTDDGKAGVYIYGHHHYRPGFDHDGDSYTELPNLRNTTVGVSSFYKLNPYSKFTLQYHNISEYRRGGNMLHRPAHEANITEQIEHDINGGNMAYDYISPNAHHLLKSYISFQHTARKSYYGGTGEGLTEEDKANALKAYGRTRDLMYVLGLQYSYAFDRLWFMPATLTAGSEYNYDGLEDEITGYHHLLKQKVRIWSGYLQNEWKNRQWSLLIGGRIDKHNLISRAILSPRVNLRYNPTDNINLRATYAGGFRAPQAFDEELHVGLAGGERIMTVLAKDLKEERSNSFSLSADLYKTFGNVQTNLLIEGFCTLLDDVFGLRNLKDPDANGTGIQERYNANKASVYGLNIEGKAAFTTWFSLQAGFTWQKNRYDKAQTWDEEAPAEKRMLRTPDTYGYFTASLTPIKHLTASFSGNYTGSMLVPHLAGSGTEKPVAEHSPSFMTLDLKLAYSLPITKSLNMEIDGGIRNMTNSYQKDFDRGWNRDSGYIYGPALPRCYYMGIKFVY